MEQITITYSLKHYLCFAEHIAFTAKGECFNRRTGRELKRCWRGKEKGYFIGNDFHSLADLRPLLRTFSGRKNKYPF